jgi:hypothetical protein
MMVIIMIITTIPIMIMIENISFLMKIKYFLKFLKIRFLSIFNVFKQFESTLNDEFVNNNNADVENNNNIVDVDNNIISDINNNDNNDDNNPSNINIHTNEKIIIDRNETIKSWIEESGQKKILKKTWK